MNRHTHFIIITMAAIAVVSGNEFLCEIPSKGCDNGLFNQTSCSCDCIPPFCPDALGNCVVSGTCDDPWKECVRGINCPWWVNPLKAESCTTGPTVPDGTWDIFPSEEFCCKISFPDSEFCEPETTPPSKHPTIALIEDAYEIVSIQFSISGLPDTDSVLTNSITNEMETALKRIVLRLAEKIEGLRVTKVQAIQPSLARRRLLRDRALLERVVQYFNVFVIRDDSKQFGPYIIQEIRDSYDEVLAQIQSFSDTKYLKGDLDPNFCTLLNGEYDLCAIQEATIEPTRAAPASQTSDILQSHADDHIDTGLAGWAVALIVILVLTFVCCGGYAIAIFCFGVDIFLKGQENTKDIQSNAYMDKTHGSYDSSKRLAIMDSKSQISRMHSTQLSRISPSNESGVQIVCSKPQYPSFDDSSFTINTYNSNRRKARDPTMFIPGRENKPDPSIISGTRTQGKGSVGGYNDRRQYSDERPVRPKREPTMYIDGKVFAINNSVLEEHDTILREVGSGKKKSNIDHDFNSSVSYGGSAHYEVEAIDTGAQYVPSSSSYLDHKLFRGITTNRRDDSDERLYEDTTIHDQSSCGIAINSKSSRRSDKAYSTSDSTMLNSQIKMSRR